MKFMIAALLAFSVQATAFIDASVPRIPSSNDFPTDSSWAIGMISIACKTDLTQVSGIYGTKEAHHGKSVIYKAYVNGQVVAAAWASSEFIWAKKQCL